MKFTNEKIEIIYRDLKSKYDKSTLDIKEVANEISCSVSTINFYLARGGIGIPKHKKIGTSKKARVVFSIVDVAEYLANTSETA